MREIKLLFILAIMGSSSLFAQTQFQKSVYFNTDQHLLTATSKTTLDLTIHEIEQLSDYTVEVRAHTDDQGSVAYNEALAQRRAKSVEDYLAVAGIISEKTTVKSFGETNPTYTNTDEEGRSKNRRVDVIVTSYAINSLDDVFSRLSDKNLQTYTIPSDKNVLLTAKNGTQFKIKAGSFAFADGTQPNGQITLEVQEAYSYSDMISNQLSTESGNRMLETGGMIYINAIADGQTLDLKDGEQMEIGMPTPQQANGMQLFTGQTVADGSVDWVATNQNYATEFADKNNKIKLEIPKPPTRPNHPPTRKLIQLDKGPKPILPEQPARPIKPREPKKESIKYEPGFFKRVFTSQEKIDEKVEAVYAKKIKQYKKSTEIYQKKLDQYKKDKMKYDIDQENYRLAVIAWERKPTEVWEDLSEAEQRRNKAKYKVEKAKYEKSLAVWKKLKEQALEKYEAEYEARGFSSAKDINKYVYAVNQMGWINCDRFYGNNEPRLPLVINDKDKVEERIFIVFKNIASIMRVRKDGNRYISSNIPGSAKVTILGVKVINGKTYLAKLETVVNAETSYDLAYIPCSLKELRKELLNVNG